ncbi:MAG: EamA family transporter [Alloprevotella sp.]|nr:EamA family transporter [Alloprevotella sp.]
MPLVWLAILLRIVSNPIGNVFQKQLTHAGRHHPLVVNFTSLAILALISFCTIGWQVDWRHLPPHFWLWAILTGLFGGIGNGFLVLALRDGELSILGPINSYKSIVGLITGVFLLGELPTLAGLCGIALIIGGSYFVFETTDEGFTWALLRNRSIRYRIWALILTATEAVFIKKVVLLSDVPTSLVVWCGFGAVFAFATLIVLRIPIRRDFCSTTLPDAGRYVWLVLCLAITALTTNYTFRYMQVGYALALFQLSILVSILFGYRFFQEQHIVQKLLGAVIMILGSVLILLY